MTEERPSLTTWLEQQAELLAKRDVINLVEEIEDMGRGHAIPSIVLASGTSHNPTSARAGRGSIVEIAVAS